MANPRSTTRKGIESEPFRGRGRPEHVLGAVGSLVSILLLGLLAVAVQAEKHPPAKPIDLNTANAKELQELPGVGPVTAKRIIDARTKSGRFKRVEDLLAIRGISQKKLDALRPYVTVSAPPAAAATPSQKTVPAPKKPGS